MSLRSERERLGIVRLGKYYLYIYVVVCLVIAGKARRQKTGIVSLV